jgi:hypothetical protein
MRRIRAIVVCLLVGTTVSGCDHGSRHRSKAESKPYSAAEVRRAFAAAGLPLGPNLLRVGPNPYPKDVLGAFMSGDQVSGDYVSLTVWGSASESHAEYILGDQKVSGTRNVDAVYPKQRRFSAQIRRALQILRRSD